MTKLRIIGGEYSHDTLRRVIEGERPSRVLDAPAGTGVMSQFLRERGWDVHCADIDPGHFAAQGFPFEQVDLNRTLPYPDASFDTVVCANGLHRLFNPGGAITQFFRVLKPGGHLHLTINNYASIGKRLRFLIYGSITNTINECRYLQNTDAPEANVRHHLFYPQLAYLLEQAGFQIVSIQAASVTWRHRLMAPLSWLVWLCTLGIAKRAFDRNRVRQTRSMAICGGGKYLYVRAQKVAAGAAAPA